jgi:signal transduction histidine kinase
LIYVYLPYGLAFIALGLVLSLQARMPVLVLPRALLWLLAAFGLTHGAHEWLMMAAAVEAIKRNAGGIPALRVGALYLAALSFLLLAQFGIEWCIRNARWPKWARGIPAALLVAWNAFAFGSGAFASAAAGDGTAEAVTRYFVAFPSALLAAGALLSESKKWHEPSGARTRRYLTGAAAALVVYALVGGLIVPAAPFWPASELSVETFLAATGVPVMIFRALCAVAIGAFLSLALVVEAARVHEHHERLREEFISVVAHDLRSPINAIRLQADLLERLPPGRHGDEDERRTIVKIKATANRLQRMVGDLLDASLVETKRLALQRQSADLGQLVREVVDRASGLTEGHAVRIVAPVAMPPVQVDPHRFEQIMLNLLSNAAKYSSPGTEIVVELEPRHSEALVSVTNYGAGITREEVPLVFDRFYRSKGPRAATEGLGLGLYIVRGFVEAHGGRVWVDSEPGRRASFRFTLPHSNHGADSSG